MPNLDITADNLVSHTAVDKLRNAGGRVVDNSSRTQNQTATVENTYKDSTSMMSGPNKILHTPPSDTKISADGENAKKVEGHPEVPPIQRYMRVRRYSYNADGTKELIGEEEMIFDPKFKFASPQSQTLITKLRNDGEKVIRRESVKAIDNSIPRNPSTPNIAPTTTVINRPPVVTVTESRPPPLSNSNSMPRLPPPAIITERPPVPVQVQPTAPRPPLIPKTATVRDISPNADAQFFNADQYSKYKTGEVIEVAYLETDPGVIVEETLRKTEQSVRREKRPVASNGEFIGLFITKPLSLDLVIKNRPGKKLGDFVKRLPDPPKPTTIQKSEIVHPRPVEIRQTTPEKRPGNEGPIVKQEVVQAPKNTNIPEQKIVQPPSREPSKEIQRHPTGNVTEVITRVVKKDEITRQPPPLTRDPSSKSPPQMNRGPFQIAGPSFDNHQGNLTFDSALSDPRQIPQDFGFSKPALPVPQQPSQQVQRPLPQVQQPPGPQAMQPPPTQSKQFQQPQPPMQQPKPKLQMVFKQIEGRQLPVDIQNTDMTESEKRLILEDYLKREGLSKNMIDKLLSKENRQVEPQIVVYNESGQKRPEVSKFQVESPMPRNPEYPRKSTLSEFLEKSIEKTPQRELSPVGPGNQYSQQPVESRPEQNLNDVQVFARGVTSITNNGSRQSSLAKEEVSSLDSYFKEIPPLIENSNFPQPEPQYSKAPQSLIQSRRQDTFSQVSSRQEDPRFSQQMNPKQSTAMSRAGAQQSYATQPGLSQMSYKVSDMQSFGEDDAFGQSKRLFPETNLQSNISRQPDRQARDSRETNLNFEQKVRSNESSLSVKDDHFREPPSYSKYQVAPPVQQTPVTLPIEKKKSSSQQSKPLTKLPSTKKALIRMKKDMTAQSHLLQIAESDEDEERRSQYRQYTEEDEDDFMDDDLGSPTQDNRPPVVVEVLKPSSADFGEKSQIRYADNRKEFGLESEIQGFGQQSYAGRVALPERRGYEASKLQVDSRNQLMPGGENSRVQFESQLKESKFTNSNRSQVQGGGFGESAFGAFDESIQNISYAPSKLNYSTNKGNESRTYDQRSQYDYSSSPQRSGQETSKESNANYGSSQRSNVIQESRQYQGGYQQSNYSQNEDQFTSQFLSPETNYNNDRNAQKSRIGNSNLSAMNRAPVGFSAFGSVTSVALDNSVTDERIR